MSLVLGVDGGGTKTLAVVMDLQKRVLGQGMGGPSNFDDLGFDTAMHNLKTAVRAACADAGISASSFDAAFLGLAGVVSETDQKMALRMALELNLAPPNRIAVDHDCRVALAGGLSDRPGIVLIAGTGSSCFGMNADGERWLAGGWGYLLADEGSGYWLGLEALKALVRATDGRGATTLLQEQLREVLGLMHVNEIMNRLYVRGISRAKMAMLAPVVLEAARGGDTVAHEISCRGAAELASCVAAVMQRLRMAQSELVLVGGVLDSNTFYQGLLVQALEQRSLRIRIVPAKHPPAVGAGLLALQMLNEPH